MNIWVQMILLVTVACLCVANASPEMRGRTKQQRPTRGFKNAEMMTARGFGKRNRLVSRTPHGNTDTGVKGDVGDELPPTRDSRGVPIFKSSSIGIARDFGKRSPENLEEEEARSRRAFKPNGKVLIARGYGKRDNMIDLSSVYGGEQPEQTHWETFEQPGEVDPNDTRDEEADRSKMESHRNVDFVETTTEHSDSEKENVQLRHTVVEKKRSKLAKPRPRSVKSMKMAKGVNKRKPTGEEKKRKPPKHIASISVDTFTKEMIKNPDFAKTVVRRFIDRNLDGYLTEEELLKIRV